MAELTTEGFVTRTLQEIAEEISGNLKATFGSSFDTSPESPDGQVIGIFAEQIFRAESAAQAVYQSSDPDRATGEALEYVCDYNGVQRIRSSATVVGVVFSGTPDTSIPAGVLVGMDDGTLFSVDLGGKVGEVLSATCTTVGRIFVEAGVVTAIKTPVAGITSVTNPSQGSTGTDTESDSALRNRRSFSVVDSGTDTIEAIYGSLTRSGAEFVSIIQNVEDTEVDTIPPHSFVTIVKGLSDDLVFQTIFNNKAAGIKAYGTLQTQVADSKGYMHEVGFSRPTDVPIDVKVTFSKKKGSPVDVIDFITRGITKDLNDYQGIGQEVIWSDVMGAAIYASNGGPSIATAFEDGVATSIKSVLIKRADETEYVATDLPMRFDEKAVAGSIEVVEVVR